MSEGQKPANSEGAQFKQRHRDYEEDFRSHVSEGLMASEQKQPRRRVLLSMFCFVGNQDHRFDAFAPLKTRRSAVSVEHDSNAFSAALQFPVATSAWLNCDPPCAEFEG